MLRRRRGWRDLLIGLQREKRRMTGAWCQGCRVTQHLMSHQRWLRCVQGPAGVPDSVIKRFLGLRADMSHWVTLPESNRPPAYISACKRVCRYWEQAGCAGQRASDNAGIGIESPSTPYGQPHVGRHGAAAGF
jgi:hypothetical protein